MKKIKHKNEADCQRIDDIFKLIKISKPSNIVSPWMNSKKKIFEEADKNDFVYFKSTNKIHNAMCPAIAKANAKYFYYASDAPENTEVCSNCAISYYTSLGAIDYKSNKKTYLQLFENEHIYPIVLKTLYLERNGKTRIIGNRLYIYIDEDTWIIEREGNPENEEVPDLITGSEPFVLYHNNYQKIGNKRNFKGGYHKHDNRPTALHSLLVYVNSYKYNAMHQTIPDYYQEGINIINE